MSFKNVEIHYQGATGFLYNTFVCSWGDLITLEPVSLLNRETGDLVLLSQGSVLRPNKELQSRTKGNTSHKLYSNLYDAFRGAYHAKNQYVKQGGETTLLQSDISLWRDYVRFLLQIEKRFDSSLFGVQLALSSRLQDNLNVRNEHKVRASENFVRGLDLKDSLNRRNPIAAAMATGGGIAQLLARVEDIQFLASHMSLRAFQVRRLISLYLKYYFQLWQYISKLRRLNICDFKLKIRDDLSKFLVNIESIIGSPFLNNVTHTSLDILNFQLALERCDQEALDVLVSRLHEGIRWVFALDFLQMKIIFPLTRFLRADQKFSEESLQAYLDFEFNVFGRKLQKINEMDLVHPIKQQIFFLLQEARSYSQVKDWLNLKKVLLVMSDVF